MLGFGLTGLAGQLTGSPIETQPTFNPMIGPSPYIQIYTGARFVPCMKNIAGLQDSDKIINWHCPNSTTNDPNDPSNHCSLSELCGFGGVPNPHPGGSLGDRPQPNQWFRFIVPMFIHGGFIHIGFNQLVQLTMGVDMERMIGWWRYALVYVASGIFGFVLGGNYAAPGLPSTGCSGALFGVLALFILDLFYTWNERPAPWTELIIMIFGVGVSFVLGLLPGLDNFSHIGGFIMGLALGLSILRSPNALRERIGLARNPYVVMSGGAGSGPERTNKAAAPEPSFIDRIKGRRGVHSAEEPTGPLGFFKGRKPLWWAWWLVRLGALVAVVVGFVMLIVNFYKYYKSTCSWCYRLSCLVSASFTSPGTLLTLVAGQRLVPRGPVEFREQLNGYDCSVFRTYMDGSIMGSQRMAWRSGIFQIMHLYGRIFAVLHVYVVDLYSGGVVAVPSRKYRTVL